MGDTVDLDEGRRLLEAATEGPWFFNEGEAIDTMPVPEGTDDLPEDEWQDAWEPWTVGNSRLLNVSAPSNAADGHLIVWLRNNAPDLLAECSSLRAERDRLRSDFADVLDAAYTLLMDEDADRQERGEAAAYITSYWEDHRAALTGESNEEAVGGQG